jgi:hypothetical protein
MEITMHIFLKTITLLIPLSFSALYASAYADPKDDPVVQAERAAALRQGSVGENPLDHPDVKAAMAAMQENMLAMMQAGIATASKTAADAAVAAIMAKMQATTPVAEAVVTPVQILFHGLRVVGGDSQYLAHALKKSHTVTLTKLFPIEQWITPDGQRFGHKAILEINKATAPFSITVAVDAEPQISSWIPDDLNHYDKRTATVTLGQELPVLTGPYGEVIHHTAIQNRFDLEYFPDFMMWIRTLQRSDGSQYTTAKERDPRTYKSVRGGGYCKNDEGIAYRTWDAFEVSDGTFHVRLRKVPAHNIDGTYFGRITDLKKKGHVVYFVD